MRVLFRYRPEVAGGEPPELRGEMLHWSAPGPMRDAGGGWLEAEAELEVGAYEYKFRHGETDWRLDPRNPRTRTAGGKRNNVLVVGGTGEPVLHAPARPYVFVEDDGRLCVRAALRRGAGRTLALRWDEGDGVRTEPMRQVGEEEEHLLFEAWLPGAGSRVDYAFALADGTVVGAPGGALFHVPVAGLRGTAPAWWRSAVVYTAFVDRFRASGPWRVTDTSRDSRCGGDLRGVIDGLDHIRELGATAVHLTPICIAPSIHRYDAVDPRRVAPELGGEAALMELLAAARSRGLRVILDVAVTHVDRGFFAFRDVAQRGPDSPYWDWFHGYAHPFSDGPRPGYLHYHKGQWREPLLDTAHPEVQDYLVATFVHWARLGADGFRIDAAADVPLALCRRIRAAVRAVRRDAVVFAEVVPSHIERWTGTAVDAATDFGGHEAMLGWLGGETTAAEYAADTERRRFRRGGPGWTALRFTGTHDQPRLRTRLGAARARLGQLLVALGAGVPLLYYGDEVGLESTAPAREFEDSWPDRQAMPWDPARWDRETLTLVRAALSLRASHPALRGGDERARAWGDEDLFGLCRTAADQQLEVIVNRGGRSHRLELGEGATLALACGQARLTAGVLHLGPTSAAVVTRALSPALDPELVEHNATLALHAYRAGSTETPAYPRHLYVTVTEACNLRCRHCITDAPARTREGRARELRPWALEALREPLALAEYVAFTHGGEALTSRMLPEVLRAAQRRTGPAPQIHLVSNGMLLTGDRVRELIDLGLTSLMVSVDGATPATNDAIRVGSSLATVLDNLRQAVGIRQERRADLRIGISAVVGRTNLDELPGLGHLARELGIDWLKIEETYPATPFARADLLAPRAPAMRAAVKALREVLVGSRVVLVDHLDPPGGCGCNAEAPPEIRAFRAADDFANRAHFAPCRAAWEQACIDPDGTVHAVDYARPALGSLADAPFLTLWNGPVAQRLRTDALARGCG